MILLKLAVI